jgi:hypothetical protein
VKTLVEVWSVIVIVCGPIAAVTVWLNQYVGLKKVRLETEKLRKELAAKPNIIAATPEEIRRYGIPEADVRAMRAEWSRWAELQKRRSQLEERSGMIAFIALLGVGLLFITTYQAGRRSGSAATAAQISRQREVERQLFAVEGYLRETIPLTHANIAKRRALLDQLNQLEQRIRNEEHPDEILLSRIAWLKGNYGEDPR